MADKTQQFNEHVPESDVVKHYAPNEKSAVLQEVEDDAVYLTERRFQEQREEAARNRDKADKKSK